MELDRTNQDGTPEREAERLRDLGILGPEVAVGRPMSQQQRFQISKALMGNQNARRRQAPPAEEPASPPVEAAAEALWNYRPMSREYDGEPKPWPTLKRYQRERYRGMAAAALKAAMPHLVEIRDA